MEKDIMKMTLEELKNLEVCKPEKGFTSIVVVPMDEIHDSGYRCMKFVLCYGVDIVGVVYTWSDVIWPNGIGNYGKNHDFLDNDYLRSKKVIPSMGSFHIDCLPESGCLRLMTDVACELDSFIGSDFMFYVKEEN